MARALHIERPGARYHVTEWGFSPIVATNVHIDGAILTNGPALAFRPGPSVVTNGFWLGSDTNGVEQAHGLLDDLWTFNYPLAAAEVFGFWALYAPLYPGLLLEQPLLVQAPSNPGTNAGTGLWDAVTGGGSLHYNGAASQRLTGGNVWIADVTALLSTNGGHITNLLSFSIEGGTNGVAYDVFGATSLGSLGAGGITNAQWWWLGQGCTWSNYSLALTDSVVFLVLGTPADSDHDGLTDAYELLVSKTDPNNPDSQGSGILDGWYVAYGLPWSQDPCAQSPSQDGWTVLQAVQNGWNPNNYYTPPPPQNVRAVMPQRAGFSQATPVPLWLSTARQSLAPLTPPKPGEPLCPRHHPERWLAGP